MTNAPHPALVTQQAAQRLPRWPLWLLCAAYLLPGLFGRDPWRGADLAAFGQMLALAEGRAPWLQPALGGVATDAALMPHWLGALAISGLRPLGVDAALAARLPFAALLALTLLGVWRACYHLARGEAAQPMPLAFGGEAAPVDYARAVSDGALLAMVATLGLLQLGHETTPELAQLAAAACSLWALAALPRRGLRAGLGLLLALPALAACGAPAMALAIGAGAALLMALGPAPSGTPPSTLPGTLEDMPGAAATRGRALGWVVSAVLLAMLVAWPTHSWAWRLHPDWSDLPALLRQWAWFLWPGWLLALWTLWRWRGHWRQRHIALPLWLVLVATGTSVAMGGSDRALMLGLPGLAVLSAFALPTLARSTSAAVDWFSVFFFTLSAAVVWLMYVAMQTGVPAKPAANILRLAPGFVPQGAPLPLALAAAATLAWAALVRWRTGRHQAALWKSLVLPAAGVALLWLLLMTLWLPLLDYARSNRPLAQRIQAHVPAGACVAAPEASTNLVAALEWHARLRVDARPGAERGACPVLLRVYRADAQRRAAEAADLRAGWQAVAEVRRPTDRHELTVVYRRAPAGR